MKRKRRTKKIIAQERDNYRWKLRHPSEAKKRPFRYATNTYIRKYATPYELLHLIRKAQTRLKQLKGKENE